MMKPETLDAKRRARRDSLIAAGVTALAALLIFLFLFWGEIGFDRSAMAAASIPEIGQEDEEELFLDPELIDPGTDVAEQEQAAAPEALGSPEVVEKPEVVQPIVKGESEKPAPPKEKLVSQKQPSSVKATEPKADPREARKAEGLVKNAFTNSGQATGRNNSAGSGGNSVGVSGSSNGWKFLGCPHPKVVVTGKVVVKVSVTVDATGRVTSAKATGGNATQRDACERAARQARWEPLHNEKARTARGTITFTITPPK